MIQYLKHHQIDKTKWDDCITQSLNSMIYGYSWYLDIVAPGWCAMVMNDYEAVFPLPTKKKFFHYVYQPYFTQQLGLFYTHPLAAEKANEILNAIPSYYKYIDIQWNEAFNELDIEEGKKISRKNFVLFLDKPYEKLLKNYSDHTKRNLKKAQRIPQQIVPCDTKKVIEQYQKNKGEETKGLDLVHYRMLQKLFDTLFDQHLVKTIAVEDNSGKIISSAAFAICPNRIYYLMGSNNKEGKENRSMYLLFDYIIQRYSAHPLVLDFEGSEIPGVARLFKGFGAEKHPYIHMRINRLPKLIRWLKG